MYTLDEEQAALNVLVTDTYDNLIKTTSADDTIVDYLICVEGKNVPTTFFL